MTPTVLGICTFAVYFLAMIVNKIDRPNTTSTACGICTLNFAVYFFATMVNKLDRPNMDSNGSWHLYICHLFCFVEIFKLFMTRVSF